jgi:hypothetical protein
MQLIIRDGTEPGGRGHLDFDLLDIVQILGEQGRSYIWRGRDIQYVSRDEQDIAPLEALGSGAAVSETHLVDGLGQLLQVIWGQFEATEPGSDSPALVIRAIDSSWWEVSSDDEGVLGAVRQRFRAVEERPSKAV